MIDELKTTIRKHIKQVRFKTPSSELFKASAKISDRLLKLEHYQQAKNVALYFSVQGEINLEVIWHHALSHGKLCYFPVLHDDLRLSFLPATPINSFKKNRFGIPEPDLNLNKAIPIEELDLIVMPLIAFDKHCTRLGTGAGCYDRTLENRQYKQLFGVAFDFQQVEYLEPEPWDIPLNAVITPKAIYWRGL
jgi:5-formyltetrahydrofolate cyclo-ligase